MHRQTAHSRRPWVRVWWAGLLVALVGVFAWPSTAEARGRRTVPNLRAPRTPATAQARGVTTIGLTVHVATVDDLPIIGVYMVVPKIRFNDERCPFVTGQA